MLTEIRLENFKSFGRLQTVPLEPITLLVGPNNSGKSNFLSIARFMTNAALAGSEAAVDAEGGRHFVFHRPEYRDHELAIGWRTDAGEYESRAGSGAAPHGLSMAWETMRSGRSGKPDEWSDAWSWIPNAARFSEGGLGFNGGFGGLRRVQSDGTHSGAWRPMLDARFVRLALDVLRADAFVVEAPVLTSTGGGLAAVLGLWRGADPQRAAELDDFLASCVPEIRHALVKPAPVPGHQRLWFAQSDGEEFDAAHVSDGLLYFTALAAHVVGAPRGTVFLLEEPEQGIHPRMLRRVGDLLRKSVTDRGCQFIIATHSTVLLDVFRDTPERILLFRRGAEGTEVTRCTALPAVVEALETAGPGELLETAFFDGAWGESTRA